MQATLFSLNDNPFRLLRATYKSTAAEISALVEDAELDQVASEQVLHRAQQALITPRSRLNHELTWLPELSQLQTIKVYDLLNESNIANILAQIDHFPELARANIAAHLCSHRPASADVVHSLAKSWAQIDEAHTLAFINDQRRYSGFPKIEMPQLREALGDILQLHAASAANWIWTLPMPGLTMNAIVDQELKTNPEGTFLRYLVEIYDKKSEPRVASIKDSILTAIEAAKRIPHDLTSHIGNISQLLEQWDEVNQPVQIYFQYRGQEEGRSKQVYEIIRELCLEIANNHGCYREALQLSEALLRTFPELESVAESLKTDISALEDLAKQKQLSDQLNPLISACENAKNNATSFATSLRSSGFTSGTGKHLDEVRRTFTEARKALPNPGVAYLIIRDLALSLNNDSNDPQSAFILVDGLIELRGSNVPEDVIDKLRDDRAILHKNWKMKELERQSGNLNAMIRVVDEMLVYASASDRRDLQKLKSNIEGKRLAKRAKLAVFAAIAGVIGFLVFADDFNNPATYRPSTSSQPPAPVASNPYQEEVPPVGSGLSLTRNQVRYCIYQGARLEYIRPQANTNYQIDMFNSLIDDYNSRCADFRYTPGVLEAVRREVSARSTVLRDDARRTVASW